MTLMEHGDLALAAAQLEKIAQLPDRPDALLKAAVCWQALGRPERRDSLIRVAAARAGGTEEDARSYFRRLWASAAIDSTR